MTNPPVTVSGPEWERGLWWMVLASGAVHLVAITLLLLMPHSFLHRPPPLHSYTVDLVAPDRLGGNNVIAGGKGRVEGAPMAAAPPAPKVEPPPPKAEEPKPPEPKPEPPKPEQVASQAEPKPAAPPPPAPKVEPKPKEDEAVLAKKVEPPKPTAPKAAPSPQAKPAPQAVAKAEAPKPPAPLPAKPDVNKAAVDAKAAKVAKEAQAAHERDEHIAAAIKRVEQQNGVRGGGSGDKVGEHPGGPISVGPGEGAGGAIKGVEYLLYYNQMINRIKQTWAWAGAERSLEAVVRFNITENGEVLNVRITHPSGDSSYDWSVERAVKAANPLPPPPDAYRQEFSDVELTFSPAQLQQ